MKQKLMFSDRKFGVKARLSQALGVTLNLLKTYSNNVRLLVPIVHVLKLYASNSKYSTTPLCPAVKDSHWLIVQL